MNYSVESITKKLNKCVMENILHDYYDGEITLKELKLFCEENKESMLLELDDYILNIIDDELDISIFNKPKSKVNTVIKFKDDTCMVLLKQCSMLLVLDITNNTPIEIIKLYIEDLLNKSFKCTNYYFEFITNINSDILILKEKILFSTFNTKSKYTNELLTKGYYFKTEAVIEYC